jgi:predicted GIY-YIG superfamily endonuclease
VYRPYFDYSSKDIGDLGIEAAEKGDIETLRNCLSELRDNRSRVNRALIESLEKAMSESGGESIPWLARAVEIVSRLTPRKRGNCRVYIVLLKGTPKEKGRFALYVGQTSHSAKRRFEQHKNGEHASKHVTKYGVRLLPELTAHLNSISLAESKEKEEEIYKALKAAHIPVYGGH